jgi:hypothetical protein
MSNEPTITIPVDKLRGVLLVAGKAVAAELGHVSDPMLFARRFADSTIRQLEAAGTTFVPEPRPILRDCSVCQRPVVLRSDELPSLPGHELSIADCGRSCQSKELHYRYECTCRNVGSWGTEAEAREFAGLHIADARVDREAPAWQLNRCRRCGDPVWTGEGPPEEGYCDEGCNGDGSWLDRVRIR